jgi:hypothetical protein
LYDGKLGEDLRWWIRTLDVDDSLLEKFGCAHHGDAPMFEPSCFLGADVADELQEVVDDDEEQEQLPSEELPIYLRADNDHNSCSHVSTHRPKSGEWLANLLNLKSNVTVVRTKEEVQTFIDVLQTHLADKTKVDWEALATAFNRRVLERPLGCSMNFKTAAYLKQYGDYLIKRVQVDSTQQERLEQVSWELRAYPRHWLGAKQT